jgi:hypothetical protein
MPKDTKEIENRKENAYGWLAFSILIIHFGLIIFSIVPASAYTKSISAISKSYTEPLFNQRWSMFAPCPTFENRIKIRYFFPEDSTHWIDPIERILPIHQKYRFTHHGNIAVGYYNMLFWLKIDLERLSIDKEIQHNFSDVSDLRNSLGNRLLHNYVFGFANDEFHQKPEHAEIMVLYRNVTNNQVEKYLFSNYK